MAGGVGTSRPFEVNPKCLIYSGALAGLYWYLPPKQPVVVVGYLLGGYVALAWYDELFNCDARLSANTILHDLTAMIKPAVVDGTYGAKKPCCKGCPDKKPCNGAKANSLGNDIFGDGYSQ
jgi:UDP-N-acetylmuramyl pentapeptide phosphotransferase/UDP-N-acetylglucosamine-1-phosphate transferase